MGVIGMKGFGMSWHTRRALGSYVYSQVYLGVIGMKGFGMSWHTRALGSYICIQSGVFGCYRHERVRYELAYEGTGLLCIQSGVFGCYRHERVQYELAYEGTGLLYLYTVRCIWVL